jgi:hypothetical protein
MKNKTENNNLTEFQIEYINELKEKFAALALEFEKDQKLLNEILKKVDNLIANCKTLPIAKEEIINIYPSVVYGLLFISNINETYHNISLKLSCKIDDVINALNNIDSEINSELFDCIWNKHEEEYKTTQMNKTVDSHINNKTTTKNDTATTATTSTTSTKKIKKQEPEINKALITANKILDIFKNEHDYKNHEEVRVALNISKYDYYLGVDYIKEKKSSEHILIRNILNKNKNKGSIKSMADGIADDIILGYKNNQFESISDIGTKLKITKYQVRIGFEVIAKNDYYLCRKIKYALSKKTIKKKEKPITK